MKLATLDVSRRAIAAVLALMVVSLFSAAAKALDLNWVGPSSGSQSWGVAGNWFDGSTNQVPYYPDNAAIGDTSAVRDILTPAGYVEAVNKLDMTQSSGGAAVNQLTLGNDFVGYAYFGVNLIGSGSATADNLVLELNSHQFSATYGSFSKVTIQSTSGPGILFGYGPTLTDSVVKSGVTVSTEGVLYGGGVMTFDSGSKLVFRGGVTSYRYGDPTPYDLEIGESGGATQGGYRFNGTNVTVLHDLTIFQPTGTPGCPLDFWGHTLFAHGNFIDHGTATSPSYNTGDTGFATANLVFNGSPASAKTVSIGRHLDNSLNLRVGNTSSDTGNIVLGADLTIAGDFGVVNGSSLDLGDRMLTAGSFTQLVDPLNAASSIEIGIDLTGTPGTVQVNGDLTLNHFVLNVSGYTDLTQDLVLFTYTGSLFGTPTLDGIIINTSTGRFFYDGFVVGDGEVKLTNVFIPEPASASLLALGGALLFRRRRR